MNGEYSGIYDCDEADPNWLYKVVWSLSDLVFSGYSEYTI